MPARRRGLAAETAIAQLSTFEIRDREAALRKRGIKQRLSQKATCSHCGNGPVLICNTWSGDFVTGRECGTPVCEQCAQFRSGIVYCWTCGERYR